MTEIIKAADLKAICHGSAGSYQLAAPIGASPMEAAMQSWLKAELHAERKRKISSTEEAQVHYFGNFNWSDDFR